MNNNIRNIIPGLPTYYIYPDAWEITITINELIAETKLLFNNINSGPYGNITTKAIV